MKRNCHNSRTSNDTDMKLAPVTKIDKRNKKNVKKSNDDIMSENDDVIAILLIYIQFGAIQTHSL